MSIPVLFSPGLFLAFQNPLKVLMNLVSFCFSFLKKKCQWDFCRNSMESVEFFELYLHLNNEDHSLDKGKLCPIVYTIFHFYL